ncbi:MAG: CRISPR-associated helicase Cas3' [Firmicutes bacterium]|nr:CRISPR-associated helicase Cas3' [Bacillota bacterium]
MNTVQTSIPNAVTIPQGLFWGKFDSETGAWLPLSAHSLDVAMVFRALCDLPAINRTLRNTCRSNLTSPQLDRLAVLVMLHDAGKANLGFQFKIFDPNAPRAGHIKELAPILDPQVYDHELHTSFLSSLPQEMWEWFAEEEDPYSYLMAIFSHHGRPLVFRGETHGLFRLAKTRWWRSAGAWDPMRAVADITHAARLAFPQAFLPGGAPLPSEPAFHHRFAGLVMLADWIGSHAQWFPIESTSIEDRLKRNRETVPKALQAIGLDIAQARAVALEKSDKFVDLFDFQPRPLQAAIDALDPADPATQLIIAESETGSGKTEAALAWFFKLFRAGAVDSLFFALPTRVAARSIYQRVRQSMERWFPDPAFRPITVLAVPGYAQVDGFSPRQLLPYEKIANRWQDDPGLRYRERHWAAEHPKRFLAAPIAIGTIDQALLSTVQVAHAHLRAICLDRSLLVVDEVHASDHYMTQLLKAVLRRHFASGNRAMLLSATLGSRSRSEYVSLTFPSIHVPDVKEAEDTPYPAITLANGTTHKTSPTVGTRKTVTFDLQPYSFELESILPMLITALQSSARVVVVLNTVDRSNVLLRALESHPDVNPDALFQCRGTICPHHGRFAPQDRTVLDHEVSKRLGPGSSGGPLVIVGTQTLEQSLDIDADFMITDLAPADVLLQRVGRLHRHNRSRPPGYERARCVVLVPPHSLVQALDRRGEALGSFRRIGLGSVYEDLRILELTMKTLLRRKTVTIPDDNRSLVEAATHPDCLATLNDGPWEKHAELVEGRTLAKGVAAREVLADFDSHFGETEFNELGGQISVRLGTDNLQLPVDRPFTSPFGVEITELVIPGHLAPKDQPEQITVEEVHEDSVYLRCGDRRYRYGRYGLEALS